MVSEEKVLVAAIRVTWRCVSPFTADYISLSDSAIEAAIAILMSFRRWLVLL